MILHKSMQIKRGMDLQGSVLARWGAGEEKRADFPFWTNLDTLGQTH